MSPSDNRSHSRFRFRPVHDHLLQSVLIVLFVGASGGSALAYWFWQRAGWQVTNMAPNQPVPFSHLHHVTQLGIDCRYCHTGVETSAYPGVPPTETCMTCHSQIWTNAQLLQPVRDSATFQQPIAWNQVTYIPNYVYFNHAVHVNRGVACTSCHGQIGQMSMTYQAKEMKMTWCLSCHRNPEDLLVPHSQVTEAKPDIHDWASWDNPPLTPLTSTEKKRMTDCTVCHR